MNDPDLAAYIRTELRGDVSRIAVPAASRVRRHGLARRLRYWLASFRGFAIRDVRGDRA